MNSKLKSYITIIAFLISGLLVLGISEVITKPMWLNPAYAVLMLFLLVNLLTAKILRLEKEIQTYWSFKKLYFLPIGVVVGVCIVRSPVLVALATKMITINDLTLNTTFTASSALLTLAVVTWEELWFRGIFLNYCKKNLCTINISLTIGLLFALVHLINPEINLLKTGPTLFFAGAFLTMVYFHFKTIWLPIGLHFGNNYLSIHSKLENHWFLGNEGYFGAIMLAGFFCIVAKLTLNKQRISSFVVHNPIYKNTRRLR